ncbi:P-loop containing nucleoside triphosphate hydrolase protein, partial [Nadsonia fulvescens var. elongata DSM 6958]
PIFYPGFWNSLEKTVAFNSDISLRNVIISSVANASFMEKIKVTTGSKQESIRTKFNSVLDSYINSIARMLTSIGQSASTDLKGLLDEPETLISLMAMLFSHNQSIYDANISIITETFDTDGRIESLRALFEYKLKESLSAYNYALKAANQAGNFGPCPKLIRVSMDIVHIFFNPRNGIYSTNSIEVKSSLDELSVFWDNSWNVLTWLYAKTLTWANLYEKDVMLEYMRDVLEYNGHLIKEFRLVEQLLAATVPGANSQVIAPTENSAIGKELLLIVVGTLHTMKSWLRLYDMSLLQYCVDNICSILELVHQFSAPFPIPLLRFFVRISVKAKDGNRTKLTKEQRNRLLISLTQVNEEGVNSLLEAIQKESEPLQPAQFQPQQRSVTPQSLASTAQNNIRRGQSQITSFATSGSRIQFPNTIHDDEDTKSSLITSMRSELVKARQKKAGLISSGPPVVIHAARPAGFNNKGRVDAKAKSKSKDVSSDSDSDSDSDDEEGLFSNKKNISKLRTVEKPTVVALDFAPKSRVSKISPKELAERNMRARLHIDLNPLYRQILSWNYHSDSDFPTENKNYTAVTTKFSSPAEYQKSFEPLLMLECWQSIKKAKEENMDKPWKIIIGSRTTVDDFFDIYASVESKVIRDNKISDADVVVLSYYHTTAEETDPKMPSSGQACCLAKIKEIKSANSEYSDVILRTYKPMDMMAHLVPRTELHGLRVSSLTPIEREYCSLKGLPYYDLLQEITKAKPTKLTTPTEEQLRGFTDKFGVNRSQATAILGSISAKGFSLIQGPPGTGKTKTILGIVGSFLTSPSTEVNSIEVAGNSNTLKKDEVPRRILICAPSNAAVDELVIRLKAGIRDHNGQPFSPKIVRLGRSDAINPNVRELTLEELVEREAAKTETEKNITPDAKLREEHSKVLAQRNSVREKLSTGKDLSQDDISALQTELHELIRKKNELGRKLDDQRERITMSYRRKDIARRNLQASIINGAQVICATLSGSSSDVLASLQLTFDTVVIDEACQCIELSALIPLKYGCTRCIMVGDPNQLPPTVLSLAAAKWKYEQSLFVRMQKNYPESVHMLDVQYRMHPSISKFPSDEFYDSKLIDGPNMDLKTKQPWHENNLFQPYRFFNVHSSEEVNRRTHSIFNKAECEIAMELYMALIAYMGEDFTGSIGVISPYKQQVFMLKNMFRTRFGENIFREIDFNTIDGFQGQEKDIIILSCVRSGQSNGVGFLNDIRRMNVAITRAKSSLWILGNEPTLLKSKVWERLILDAKNRDAFYSLKKGF